MPLSLSLPVLSFSLSLSPSLSLSLPPSLCLSLSIPISLSLLRSCWRARPSPSTFTSYTLSFTTARFIPNQLFPSSSIMRLALSFKTRAVSVSIRFTSRVLLLSSLLRRERLLFVYHPAVHPILSLFLPHVGTPPRCLPLFTISTQPLYFLGRLSFSRNYPVGALVSPLFLSSSSQPSLSHQKHRHVTCLCLASGFYLSVFQALSRFHLRVSPSRFFPTRRLLPLSHIPRAPPSSPPLFLRCPSDCSTLFSDSHPVLFLDATLPTRFAALSLPPQGHNRRYLRAQHVHRSISAHLRSCQAGPIPYLLMLPCLRAYGCVHTAARSGSCKRDAEDARQEGRPERNFHEIQRPEFDSGLLLRSREFQATPFSATLSIRADVRRDRVIRLITGDPIVYSARYLRSLAPR